jgi:hypothetical protein
MDSYLRLKHNYLSNGTIGFTEKFDEIFNKIINKYLLFSILSLRFYHKGIIYYLIKYLNETNDDVRNELLTIILSKIPKYKDKELNRIQRFNEIDISSTDLIFLVFYDTIKDNIKIEKNVLRFTLPLMKDYSFRTNTTLHGLLLNPITIQKKIEKKVEQNDFTFQMNYDTINENFREQILNSLYKIRKKGREIISNKNIPLETIPISKLEYNVPISLSNDFLSNNIVIYKENNCNNNKIIFIILLISVIIFLTLSIILKMCFL